MVECQLSAAEVVSVEKYLLLSESLLHLDPLLSVLECQIQVELLLE